ncbi:MAG: hypothetical protein AAFX87_17295 [Bacteroidota bacterium]
MKAIQVVPSEEYGSMIELEMPLSVFRKRNTSIKRTGPNDLDALLPEKCQSIIKRHPHTFKAFFRLSIDPKIKMTSTYFNRLLGDLFWKWPTS